MTRRHWLNLVGQFLIFASMATVAAIDENIFVVAISISLLVLPPVNWAVAGVLVWTSRQDPSVRSLADASDNALTWAVNSTVAAIIGIVALLRVTGLVTQSIGTIVSVLIGFIVVTSSLPAFRFLRTWREVWLPMIRHDDDTTTEITIGQ